MLKRTALTVLLAMISMTLAGVPAVADQDSDDEVTVVSEGRGSWSGRATWGDALARGKEDHRHKRSSTPRVRRLGSKVRTLSETIMCREAREALMSCAAVPAAGKKAGPVRVRRDLAAVARTLVTQIGLPDPTPRVGPDPAVNEWGMVAVGFPLWLWTAGPGAVSDRVRAYGVTFTLRARWVSTRFDMGDGHSVLCTRMQPYTESVRPGSRAPWCGYSYGRASLPEGSYTVTATTNWRVRWSALGVSGSMPASFTGTRMLPVGELNALIVK